MNIVAMLNGERYERDDSEFPNYKAHMTAAVANAREKGKPLKKEIEDELSRIWRRIEYNAPDVVGGRFRRLPIPGNSSFFDGRWNGEIITVGWDGLRGRMLISDDPDWVWMEVERDSTDEELNRGALPRAGRKKVLGGGSQSGH